MKFLAVIFLSIALINPAEAGSEIATSPSDSQQIAHVLNRLTFGARPGDEQMVRSIGVQRFIQTQLNPASMPESPVVLAHVQKSSAVLTAPSSKLLAQFQMQRKQHRAALAARDNSQPLTSRAKSDRQQETFANEKQAPYIQEFGRRANRNRGGSNLRTLVQSGVIDTKIIRGIESPRQLNELMTDFWFNHFNVSISKGPDHVLVGVYEEQAIRPYVFGNFRDLLGATMHHPAMMFYLDNAQNTKAGFQSKNPDSKKNGINENYARELLELHTLGVDGGYTQKDVMELARVLTGWGLPGGRNASSDGGYHASFDQRRHDFDDKIVLGQTIKGSGEQEIEQVLDFLAKHPSTAHHVSYQLAQYFVADSPPPALVNKLSASYQKSQGNIKTVLSALFASPEFWDPQYQNSKFKSPFRYAISAFRATGQPISYPRKISSFLKAQGQPLYGCLTPDGYKNTKEAWLNPDGLIKRMEFASQIGNATSSLRPIDFQTVRSAVNGGHLSPKTLQAIGSAPPSQRIAALIGSPEFMRY